LVWSGRHLVFGCGSRGDGIVCDSGIPFHESQEVSLLRIAGAVYVTLHNTYDILKESDMGMEDRITVVSAIGHHDESTGGATDSVSAALIIADKTDVRRSRVREKNEATFDKHDRVNYAVMDAKLKVDTEKHVIALNLQIDTKICTMYVYFEIFLGRMMMCRGAADVLGMTFKLTANGSKVL